MKNKAERPWLFILSKARTIHVSLPTEDFRQEQKRPDFSLSFSRSLSSCLKTTHKEKQVSHLHTLSFSSPSHPLLVVTVFLFVSQRNYEEKKRNGDEKMGDAHPCGGLCDDGHGPAQSASAKEGRKLDVHRRLPQWRRGIQLLPHSSLVVDAEWHTDRVL